MNSKIRSLLELQNLDPDPKFGKYNFDENGQIPTHQVFRRYCEPAPKKFHQYYMYKPVIKYTWSEDNGSMHQLVYCRYCTETFESIIKVEKDKNGRFRAVREIRRVETVIKDENGPENEDKDDLKAVCEDEGNEIQTRK